MFRFLAAIILLLPITSNAESYTECYKSIRNMQELEPIAHKAGLDVPIGSVTFEVLASSEKATDEDKPLIATLANKRQECWGLLKSNLESKSAPESVKSTFEASNTEQMNLMAALYGQEITYGQYVRGMQEAASRGKKSLSAISNADNSRSMEQLLQGMSNAFKNVQPKPVINCSSSKLGDSINTTCR